MAYTVDFRALPLGRGITSVAIDAKSPLTKPATPKAIEGGTSPTAAPKEPFGNSGATQATPNAGYDAAALQRIGVIIKQVQDVMTLVGAQSEIGKPLLEVLTKLVKMVPSGTVSPASEKNMLSQMQMKATQNQNMAQQLKQMQQGGAPGAGMGAAA